MLPRAADNQPPRILNELRQLSCRLVASGIAKGLLKEEDLPEIRKTLVNRFQVSVALALVGGVPVDVGGVCCPASQAVLLTVQVIRYMLRSSCNEYCCVASVVLLVLCC